MYFILQEIWSFLKGRQIFDSPPQNTLDWGEGSRIVSLSRAFSFPLKDKRGLGSNYSYVNWYIKSNKVYLKSIFDWWRERESKHSKAFSLIAHSFHSSILFTKSCKRLKPGTLISALLVKVLSHQLHFPTPSSSCTTAFFKAPGPLISTAGGPELLYCVILSETHPASTLTFNSWWGGRLRLEGAKQTFRWCDKEGVDSPASCREGAREQEPEGVISARGWVATSAL